MKTKFSNLSVWLCHLTTKQKLQGVGALFLLLCLFPLPYGFFTLVRVVMTIIGSFLAYDYFKFEKTELAITFAVIAVLFQPFFMLALGRELWMVVDVAVAVLLLVLLYKNR